MLTWKTVNGKLTKESPIWYSIKISLRESSVMRGKPIIPCVCYWDGRGFVAGFMRASSSVRKVMLFFCSLSDDKQTMVIF